MYEPGSNYFVTRVQYCTRGTTNQPGWSMAQFVSDCNLGDLERVCALGFDHQVRVQDSEVEVKVSAGRCSICLWRMVCWGAWLAQ